jgi:uncharacterized membrane protein YobD (UPF0266 family)
MGHGQKQVLIWVVIIGVIAYAANINVGHFITGVLNALQSMHNANAH